MVILTMADGHANNILGSDHISPPYVQSRSISLVRSGDVSSETNTKHMGVLTGVCVFRGDGVSGSVTLSQDEAGGPTKIAGTIKGLDAGKHGFHIHEFGDLSQGCSSTGGHFNPMKMAHGAPTASERHFGDLGNIVANEDGVATVSITDSMVTLIGDNSVIGRAFIIHEIADDLGKTSHQLSKTTGNAGGRVAGGVIGRGKAA